MHSTAQVHWFCGENAMKGWRKKHKTKGGRKTIKIDKEKRDKRAEILNIQRIKGKGKGQGVTV